MRKIWIAVILFLTPCAVFSLQHSDLSPDAKKLMPEGKMVSVTLKNHKIIKGMMGEESPTKVVVKVRVNANISTKRNIMRSDIASIKNTDITSILAAKLMEIELDPEKSFTEEQYKHDIALFTEFMNKCKGAPEYEDIKKRCQEFSKELFKQQ